MAVVLEGADGERMDYCVRRARRNDRLLAPLPITDEPHHGTVHPGPGPGVSGAIARLAARIYQRLGVAGVARVVGIAGASGVAGASSQPADPADDGRALELAAGNFAGAANSRRDDEIGRAIEAFNDSAERLEESRDRLIYLTQLASWEMLARKMAHEVKNSLTPIRLTVEEMVARQSGA